MATKDQERKALQQIRKIVDSLGDESYIGRAFDGCFEIAESNIDNDFWNSPKESIANVTEKLHTSESENITLKEMNKKLVSERDTIKQRADRISNQYTEACDCSIKNWNNFREQQNRADELENEIIKLKAKLYDLLIKD